MSLRVPWRVPWRVPPVRPLGGATGAITRTRPTCIIYAEAASRGRAVRGSTSSRAISTTATPGASHTISRHRNPAA